MQGKEIKTDFYAEVNKIHLQMLWSTLSMKELLQQINFRGGIHHHTKYSSHSGAKHYQFPFYSLPEME